MSIVCLLGMCVIDTETMAAGPIHKTQRGKRKTTGEREMERKRKREEERDQYSNVTMEPA